MIIIFRLKIKTRIKSGNSCLSLLKVLMVVENQRKSHI